MVETYTCGNCKEEFKREIRKKDLNKSKSGLSFCSRSCAAKFTNLTPKRKRTKICKTCNNLIRSDYTYCKDCRTLNGINWEKVTYGEMVERRKYQKNSAIRTLARKIYIDTYGKNCPCSRCSYKKHVQICHIKGISTHTDNTPVSEINKIENLIALCPNCHWELDHGLLELNNISYAPQRGLEPPINSFNFMSVS